MADWDELEWRLKALAEQTARMVSDPLDAAGVRRLGMRRHRRRWVVSSVFVAGVLIVFGGVGVYADSYQPQPLPPVPVSPPISVPLSSTSAPSPGPTERVGSGRRLTTGTSSPLPSRPSSPPAYPRSEPSSPNDSPDPPTSDPSVSDPSVSEPAEPPEPSGPAADSTEIPEPEPTSEPTSEPTGGNEVPPDVPEPDQEDPASPGR